MTSVQQNLPSSGMRRSRNTAPPGISPDLALWLPRQPLLAALPSAQNLRERPILLWLPSQPFSLPPALRLEKTHNISSNNDSAPAPEIRSGGVSFSGLAEG